MPDKKNGMNEFPLLDESEGIPLFYPYISEKAKDEVLDTLNSRWIGQGPKVDIFERKFSEIVAPHSFSIATGSGTDSLHLSYLLANIKPDDEVITPVFTCTATNLPLLYEGAKPIFADIDPLNLNINVDDIEHRITNKTKAIVSVDYGGIPSNYERIREICDAYKLIFISDAAQSLGTKFKGKSICDFADFTNYSFQAIKTITTADGGMLVLKNKELYEKAKRLRWFGIDRGAKQKGIWENDISEIGYKYQMTDLSASLGIAAISELETIIKHRKELHNLYISEINNPEIIVINADSEFGTSSSPWLCTLIVNERRLELMNKLRSYGIESAQVHYRNDRYSVFGGRKSDLPFMDALEDKYLVLPLHHKVQPKDIKKIATIINEGW